MRMSIALVLVLAGCTGDAPPSNRTCAGNLYDLCLTEHDCMSGNCHTFASQGFEVCSTPCTTGDDRPCKPNGEQATCSAGYCTPAAANDCKLPHQ
ncbi:MAG: hypothetical protein E6J91_24435 [Deltaproteobacteria bacterium]|nr:MAG: hypothetical protein E6J91_24435 [Deltaproteobacteria bacterium]